MKKKELILKQTSSNKKPVKDNLLPFAIESPLLTTVQEGLQTKKVLVSSILRLPYLHPGKKKNIFSVDYNKKIR
jgi:hypothetical protein